MKQLLRRRSPRRPIWVLTVAVLSPAVATLAGLPIRHVEPVGAASILLLSVVLAAAVGGLASGLAASALAFASLNFFFTPPLHTLRVERAEDVVALAVFLLVAVIVGSLVARAVDQRDLAARREEETRLLDELTTLLLSGKPLPRVLNDVAAALLEPFDLARCEIRAVVTDQRIEATAERPGARVGASRHVVPIAGGGASFGELTAIRGAEAAPVGPHDDELLRAHARQLAGAFERAELDSRVRGAQRESETNELRAALFSSVTHDLRTPLASIKASVTGLLGEDVELTPEQERELSETILEETDRLDRLVGNILDLARIRSGALAPATEPTPVDEAIEAVLHRLRRDLTPFHVRVLIRPDLPDVMADPLQLDQVLSNILENAIRFSPPDGNIIVSAAPARSSSVRLRIADDGPGIPAELRERVFEPFHRGDAGGSRAGTGLGLAIARAIVSAHRGRIWIEETPAGGAAVILELPTGVRSGMQAPRQRADAGGPHRQPAG
jgi:two-component system, OmpR family, sensor histidine kinase KdpD